MNPNIEILQCSSLGLELGGEIRKVALQQRLRQPLVVHGRRHGSRRLVLWLGILRLCSHDHTGFAFLPACLAPHVAIID